MTELVKVADINKAHKNPIAELVQIACKFDSHIEIEGEGKNINAKSLMGIMAFGLKKGMEVSISAKGTDKLTTEGILGVILLGKADEVKAAAKETVK